MGLLVGGGARGGAESPSDFPTSDTLLVGAEVEVSVDWDGVVEVVAEKDVESEGLVSVLVVGRDASPVSVSE